MLNKIDELEGLIAQAHAHGEYEEELQLRNELRRLQNQLSETEDFINMNLIDYENDAVGKNK